MEGIKEWLKHNSYRAVKIENHVSGVRVTLSEGWGFYESVSAVKDNIKEAFEECLSYLPDARMNWKKRELDKLQEEIKEKQGDLKDIKDKYKKLQDELGKGGN